MAGALYGWAECQPALPGSLLRLHAVLCQLLLPRWFDDLGGVRAELARVVKSGGLLVANFPDEENFILANSIRQPDGSLLITSDPYGLRNGSRFMAANNAEEIAALLSPQFRVMSIGHQNDDFYGIRVSGYLVVAQRL